MPTARVALPSFCHTLSKKLLNTSCEAQKLKFRNVLSATARGGRRCITAIIVEARITRNPKLRQLRPGKEEELLITGLPIMRPKT